MGRSDLSQFLLRFSNLLASNARVYDLLNSFDLDAAPGTSFLFLLLISPIFGTWVDHNMSSTASEGGRSSTLSSRGSRATALLRGTCETVQALLFCDLVWVPVWTCIAHKYLNASKTLWKNPATFWEHVSVNSFHLP